MEISSMRQSFPELAMDYDRTAELKAFDKTKAGVKGLTDAGLKHIPKIFVRPPEELAEELNCPRSNLRVPVIDLAGIDIADRRKETVEEVKVAAEKWGFFQVVNHEIPLKVMDGMIHGLRLFNEGDQEVKKELYTRDRRRKVRFNCNHDLYKSQTANWRDTLTISMLASDSFDPEILPVSCRETTTEYARHVMKLGDALFDLLSEALGLKPDHLRAMECAKGCTLVCHYYPPCPEPELTLGASTHSDPSFLTVLLQDQIGALQVIHEDQWVDVEPIPGGLVVNIADLLQILSNDKFKSIQHRVVAKRAGPRISVACFFSGHLTVPPKPYGPIKELLSEESPPVYREITLDEYVGRFFAGGLEEKNKLDCFKTRKVADASF
ncbi:1-aminocyclopropane-1-carboxylate oxidase homolog 1-like [Malania oleifera]|uniref:1-aminocyclopropane-1-carboxylate oxidase homolog 1-like n=1 Tax=Malania oleifera TaxID=397392 RepID=UPI0025AE7691|nr:1-aminocyclopropane-1-carboxylate oxidase homolog 1-like [Malania oleifera]